MSIIQSSRKAHGIFWLLIALLSLFASAQSEAKPRERWAIFSPAFTEIVFYLDPYEARRIVVGVDEYSLYPLNDLPKVGSYLKPDFEKLLSLRVNRIFIQGKNDKLAKFCTQKNIAIEKVEIENLADIRYNIRKASLMLATENARANDDLWNKRLEALKRIPPVFSKTENRRTFILTHFRLSHSSKGLMSAGRRTFLNDAVQMAGGENIFIEKSGWISVPLEEIISAKPRFVLEFTGGKKLSESTKEQHRRFWKRWLKNPVVLFLEQDYHLTPGPRVLKTIRDISKAYHSQKNP